MRKCKKCGLVKPLEEFHKSSESRLGRRLSCRDCINLRNRNTRANNPEQALIYLARERAKAKGLPCTITSKDITIPKYCPVLGIELRRGKTGWWEHDSPSIDCFIPELGYTPENISIISCRANHIKSDASIEEVDQLLKWMKKRQNAV